MTLEELKERIAARRYDVPADLVAEAMLPFVIPRRRAPENEAPPSPSPPRP